MNADKNLSVFIRVHPWLILLLLLLPACTRKAAPAGPRRIAIVRFENLSATPQMDWMGRAFSEVISAELATVPDLSIVSPARILATQRTMGARPVSAPGVSAEGSSALAAGANRVGYGTYWFWNGKLEARLEIEDAGQMKDVQILSASAPEGDLVGAATALARQISGRAARYATTNEKAAMDYAGAIEAADASAMEARAGSAIAADPDFTPPYLVLAQLKLAHDRAGALALLNSVLARPALQPAGRARVEIAAARLREDAAGVEQGLAALALLEPADAENWRTLAVTAFERRDFRQAMTAWQRVLALEPEDINGLNQLAYAAVYAGDFGAGADALRRYAVLRPQDPNALDSLGDINLIAGRLKEAEEAYLQAVKKNPNFYGGADWFKAAMARLMTGDVAGADGLAAQFTKARSAAGDAAVPFFDAEWLWISGRREEGYSALQQFAQKAENGAGREAASRAYSQLALWSLILGQQPVAGQMATKAVSLAVGASATEALVARFLAQPPASAAEWQARAGRLAPNPQQQNIRDTVLAYALLLSREFAPAADVLHRLYNSAGSSGNEGLPVLLAWAYLETGRQNDAAPLLEFNPVPPITGPGVFTALYFPRLFELRARLAEKQGQTQAAQENRKVFALLSGHAVAWEPQKAPANR